MISDELTNSIEMFSKGQVAKLIGCSEMTVHRLIRDRKLGYYRLGSRVCISRKHVEDFLAGCERKPKTAKTA
jgi:excisionase family DNA binding protein